MACASRMRGGGVAFRPLDPVELRRYALYWDKIQWPAVQGGMFMAPPQGANELQAAGILAIPVTRFTGRMDLGEAGLRAQLETFRRLSGSEPNQWALAQVGPELVLPDDQSEDARILEVELIEALPTPTAEVPMAQILEFKGRCGAELERLRHALDGLYLTAIGSADPRRASEHAVTEVRHAIADVHRVLRERGIANVLSSLKAELNVSGALAGAAAVATATSPWVGALGFLAAVISISAPLARRPKALPSDLRDFAYLASVKTNFPLDERSWRPSS